VNAELVKLLGAARATAPASMVVRAMERWKTDDTALLIAGKLSTVNDLGDRLSVFGSLERLKDPRTAELVAAQFSRDSNRVCRVLRALGPAAEEPLLRLLPNSTSQQSIDICRSLGEVGTEKSLPALQALVDGKAVSKISAQSAIDSIKGRR
jgi:hypothetical protein